MSEKKKQEDKKTEAKPEEGKKLSRRWIVILAVAFVFGSLGYTFLLEITDEIKAQFKPTSETVEVTKQNEERNKLLAKPIDYNEEENLLAQNSKHAIDPQIEAFENKKMAQAPKEIISQAKLVQETQEVQPKIVAPVATPQDSEEMESLRSQQRWILLYLASQDVKNSLGEQGEFNHQLKFLEAIAKSLPQVRGKVDLLNHAAVGGIPTVDSLKKELKTLTEKAEEAKEKTILESIGNSFKDIVKVTKVEGEVSGEDIYTIYKKAERALNNREFDLAIAHVQPLGAAADSWVMKVNNLKRIVETVDYLVDYSKGKLGA